ncbi:MAG: hypothetical protein K8R53_12380 [Bacteroidales bacterium]|nr:hypothetical protein [Bacteroidales bacterium]
MKYLLVVIFWATGLHFITGQTQSDTLIKARKSQIDDYTSFKEKMKERTWLNLVNMNLKAEKILKTDDELIINLIRGSFETERTYNTKISELREEIKNLKIELEKSNREIEKYQGRIPLFLYSLVGLAALLILFFILFIVKQRNYSGQRYKTEKSDAILKELNKEIELLNENIRTKEELIRNNESRFKAETMAIELNNQQKGTDIERLESEITDLKEMNGNLRSNIRQLENDLQKEVKIKQEVENKISMLIERLKEKII